MIKNERQYRITKAEAGKFKAAVESFDDRPEAHPGVDPRLIPVMKASLESELEILQSQLQEYERLKRHKRSRLKLEVLNALPSELIRARIAAGLTQTELARRLGVKPQQIQKYEANDYAMASFARVLQIAQTIDQAAKGE
jgi:DNA-binding XRE family transcriptional regulator